jgi:hypothetical protein
MNIKVLRYNSTDDFTNGLFFIDGVFYCHTIEDEKRDVKIKGETRIPSGVYEIGLRTEGGFHNRYTKKFGSFHRGMLQIKEVPNFEYILIHIGNTYEDTAGCLLVGNTADTKKGFIGDSTGAYKEIYNVILGEIECNEPVSISILDI